MPFVPVMPTVLSAAVGSPYRRAAAGAIARAHVVDEDLRDAQPERPLHDQRDGAARDRLGREVVPVAGEARDAEEERARRHGAGVVGERGHLDVAGGGPGAGGDASAGDDVGEQHQRRSVERAAGAPLTAAGCRR